MSDAIPAIVRSLRPNYPYSIIPGGIYSKDDLRNDVKSDQLVRAHYADFDIDKAHLVVSRTNTLEYVSYRMRDKIFWTVRKLNIPKGEILISDGTHLARARCGNRLSETAISQTSNEEAPMNQLSLPTFTMDLFKSGLVPSITPIDAEKRWLWEASLDQPISELFPIMLTTQLPNLTTPLLLSAPDSWGSTSTQPFGSVITSGIPVQKNQPSAIMIPPITPMGSATEVPEPKLLAMFALILLGGLYELRRCLHTR